MLQHNSPPTCPIRIQCFIAQCLATRIIMYQIRGHGAVAITRPSKASGPDGILAQMLKNMPHSIAPSITKLFNLSILSGQFPSAWKLSHVVPIPKSNNHASPTNYRPILLLSVLSKLLERHVYGLIVQHLESNSLLSNCQWGFELVSLQSLLAGP